MTLAWWDEPEDFEFEGEWYCGIHEYHLDPRYGCRYCPGGGL
jgi:hypothetical protein